jgi:predicted RNA-binding Zn-ribbon protein involved in translation (DUF1610 family)
MKDRILFDYVEAQVQVTCVLCNKQFSAFPDNSHAIFECPRCERGFIFTYLVRPLNDNEITKLRQKDNPVL